LKKEEDEIEKELEGSKSEFDGPLAITGVSQTNKRLKMNQPTGFYKAQNLFFFFSVFSPLL
jgi:hypothetical protein